MQLKSVSFALITLGIPAGQAALPARFDCRDVEIARLQLSVHALNLSNTRTTHTPSGGPFVKRRVILGRDDVRRRCSARLQSLSRPSHPDADVRGFIKYPNIEPTEEKESLNAAATRLLLLAKSGVCSTAVLADASAL